MLLSAATIEHLRAALTTSLRQHLTNKRRRSIAANLYKRVHTMLQIDPTFRVVGSAQLRADQRWTLAAQASLEPSPLTLEELLGIACELTDTDLAVVRYGPFSQKLSPILRDPKLRDFVEHLLRHSKGSLALRAIVDVMRFRFSLPTEEHTELHESLPSPMPDPESETVTRTAARSVVARLDMEHAGMLAAYFRAEGDFDTAASTSGVPPGSIRRAVRTAFEMICESSDSLEQARVVLEGVERLVLEGGD